MSKMARKFSRQLLENTHLILVTVSLFASSNFAFAQENEVRQNPSNASSEGEFLPDLVIEEGRVENLVGIGESASEGKIGQNEFESRPILRTGELLETVPGLIVTQHSGTGKANQYFLRGFNLDHGTDFRTEVDGMPVNLPTHAHGQGYSDINFIIPELVNHIEYKKGVYYAEEGDFSSAGAAKFILQHSLPKGIASFSFGSNTFARTLVADSTELGSGDLLLGLELQNSDGPWEVEEQTRKINGIARYTVGGDQERTSITAMAYRGIWDSTDQIASRAVDENLIPRLGNLDPTDGGNSSRYSLSADWQDKSNSEAHSANIYAIYYRLDLFSNFTYFLDNQNDGDQFQQIDRRTIVGGATDHEYFSTLLGKDSSTKVGLQVRSDFIPTVALKKTKAREELSTVRDDSVIESTAGIFAKNETKWTDKFRSTLGARGDIFYFDVDSDNDENSGDESDGKISPKAGLIFGPWADTEFYLNGGYGFHSNDARGTTISVDPVTNEPAEKVDPLVVSRGAEVGARTAFTENLQSTISLWALSLDSELLFVGDAGSTEASDKSKRIGVEFANYYRVFPWLTLDADYSLSRARFDNADSVGDHIPGSVESVLATGISLGTDQGAFGSLRLRSFGPRPLIEDYSVRSHSTTLLNARVGYGYENIQLALEALNLLDSKDHDIDYLYSSRLPGEPDEGIEDIHFHPVEPFQIRGTVNIKF